MPHAMILIPHAQEPDWMDRAMDARLVRATADLSGGSFRALAFASPESAATLPASHAALCAAMDCGLYVLRSILSVPSHIRPAEDDLILFALLSIVPGHRRQFAAQVRTLGDPDDGVQEAVALTFGAPGVEAVVELVGPDVEALTARLLDLADVDTVTGYDTHFTTPDRTRGFGGRAER